MKTPLLLLLSAGAIFAQQTLISVSPVTLLWSAVKANPYSAQAVTETVQTLPDGNHITQKTSSPVYRDGQGRLRRETVPVAALGPAAVTIIITDPVAGVNWTLNPSTQIAFRTERPALPALPPPSAPLPTSPTGGSIGVLFQQGPGSNSPLMINGAIAGSPAAGAGLERGDVIVAVNGQAVKDGADLITRINSVTAGSPVQITYERDGKPFTVTMITQPRVRTFGSSAPGPTLTREQTMIVNAGLTPEQTRRAKGEDLGTMDIEGLPARGTRTTITYAAGEAGNERPFSVTNEVWYSADLQAVLISKHNDPRSGDVTYRLTEIKRSEPPAAVFEVPNGYTIRTAPGR